MYYKVSWTKFDDKSYRLQSKIRLQACLCFPLSKYVVTNGRIRANNKTVQSMIRLHIKSCSTLSVKINKGA